MSALSLSEFADKFNTIIPIIMKELSRRQFGDIIKTKATIPQLLVLNFLELQGETKMKDLAGFMNVTTAAITGIVDRLVRDKCVMRVYDQNDRRIIRVKLTEKGRDLLNKANEHKHNAVVNIFGKLSDTEREQYLRILMRVKDILESEEISSK